MLEMKFQSYINRVIEKIADHDNVDPAAIQETLDMQPDKLSEGKLIDTNEEKWLWEEHEDGPEVMTAKNSALKELSKIFHNIESAKNKMLEAYPNLERSMTIHQGIEKILIPYHKF